MKYIFPERLSCIFSSLDFVYTHRPNSQQLGNNRLHLITVVLHFCKSPVTHTHTHRSRLVSVLNTTAISLCISWHCVTRFAEMTYLSGFFTLNMAFKAFNLESACKNDKGQMLTDRLMFGFCFFRWCKTKLQALLTTIFSNNWDQINTAIWQ